MLGTQYRHNINAGHKSQLLLAIKFLQTFVERHKIIDMSGIHHTISRKSALNKIIARKIIQARYKCRTQKPTDKIISSDKIIAKTRSKAQNFC